jgi:hypothetical protein
MGWIAFIDDDDMSDCVIILPIADVVCITQQIDEKKARISSQGVDGKLEHYDTAEIATFHSLDDALRHMAKTCNPARCRVCGCTDEDCSQCVENTGTPCSWVAPDLCSACAPDAFLELPNVGDIGTAAHPIEPETSYARALQTKTCPHCQGNIEANIWDCPVCARSLSEVPDGRKPGDEWTTPGGRLLRYVPWTDQLGPTLAVLDVAANEIIAMRDASCIPRDFSGPGKPTIGLDD